MPDAVTPNFKIKWTKKDSKTYNVPGKTYEDVFEFFQKKNAKMISVSAVAVA